MHYLKVKPKREDIYTSTLSLSDWPKQPFSPNRNKLSPKTYKVLKSSKVTLQEIVPRTFQQFLMGLNAAEKEFADVSDLFTQENNRRNQKVQILRQIWKKQSKSLKQIKSSRESSKSFNHYQSFNSVATPLRNSFFQRKARDNSMRTLYTRTKPNPYQDYYSSRDHRAKKKQFFCDESTRSKRNANQYQIQSKKTIKNSKKKAKNELDGTQKDRILKILSKMMGKWSEIERQHRLELDHLQSCPDFSQKQKERLNKIHKIQKQQINFEIKKIKEKLGRLKKRSDG